MADKTQVIITIKRFSILLDNLLPSHNVIIAASVLPPEKMAFQVQNTITGLDLFSCRHNSRINAMTDSFLLLLDSLFKQQSRICLKGSA